MSTEWEPVADITDVELTAVQIAAAELRKGDIVFDAFGGEHVIDSVRLFKHVVAFRREDRAGYESFPREWIITIKRAS